MSQVKTVREVRSDPAPKRNGDFSTNVMVPPLLRVALDLFLSCAEHPCAGMNIETISEARFFFIVFFLSLHADDIANGVGSRAELKAIV